MLIQNEQVIVFLEPIIGDAFYDDESFDGALLISSIVSKTDKRRTGKATEALKKTIEFAKSQSKRLICQAAYGEFGRDALKAWYKRHGFIDTGDYLIKYP